MLIRFWLKQRVDPPTLTAKSDVGGILVGSQKGHGGVKNDTSTRRELLIRQPVSWRNSGMDGTLTRAGCLVEKKYTICDLPGLQRDDASTSGRLENDGALLRRRMGESQ